MLVRGQSSSLPSAFCILAKFRGARRAGTLFALIAKPVTECGGAKFNHGQHKVINISSRNCIWSVNSHLSRRLGIMEFNWKRQFASVGGTFLIPRHYSGCRVYSVLLRKRPLACLCRVCESSLNGL